VPRYAPSAVVLGGGSEKLSPIGPSYGNRMREQSLESADEGLRIVIESHLLEHAATVVVNALTGEFSLFIEGKEST
jgi:hypothetical protein